MDEAEPPQDGTLFLSNSLRVHYQPKGVVGVIATWNFPVYLSVGPLAAALAAGNRVMIKMPEVTPRHQRELLKRMLGEVFDEDHVALIGGEARRSERFLVAAVQPHRLHRLAGSGPHRDAPGRRRT